jgi:DNA-3-methyladenine glycosylase II
MTPSQPDMRAIVDELSSRDARLAEVVRRHRLCTLGQRDSESTHFESLVRSVVSQQLSVKAADTIYGRFRALARDDVSPENIATVPDEGMREAGLSGAKSKTIRGMADAVINGRVNINQLHEIDDDGVIAAQLTSLWGIGGWTVDMFMMHRLGRLDVWPTGDVGVRRGWEKIFELTESPDVNSLNEAGEKFRPYRSVVAWYCWQELDA